MEEKCTRKEVEVPIIERRSSILKRDKLRITVNSHESESEPTPKSLRRVSFASSNFIKPFAADPEKNTIWDSTYEEAVDVKDSTKSSSENNADIFNMSSVGSYVCPSPCKADIFVGKENVRINNVFSSITQEDFVVNKENIYYPKGDFHVRGEKCIEIKTNKSVILDEMGMVQPHVEFEGEHKNTVFKKVEKTLVSDIGSDLEFTGVHQNATLYSQTHYFEQEEGNDDITTELVPRRRSQPVGILKNKCSDPTLYTENCQMTEIFTHFISKRFCEVKDSMDFTSIMKHDFNKQKTYKRDLPEEETMDSRRMTILYQPSEGSMEFTSILPIPEKVSVEESSANMSLFTLAKERLSKRRTETQNLTDKSVIETTHNFLPTHCYQQDGTMEKDDSRRKTIVFHASESDMEFTTVLPVSGISLPKHRVPKFQRTGETNMETTANLASSDSGKQDDNEAHGIQDFRTSVGDLEITSVFPGCNNIKLGAREASNAETFSMETTRDLTTAQDILVAEEISDSRKKTHVFPLEQESKQLTINKSQINIYQANKREKPMIQAINNIINKENVDPCRKTQVFLSSTGDMEITRSLPALDILHINTEPVNFPKIKKISIPMKPSSKLGKDKMNCGRNTQVFQHSEAEMELTSVLLPGDKMETTLSSTVSKQKLSNSKREVENTGKSIKETIGNLSRAQTIQDVKLGKINMESRKNTNSNLEVDMKYLLEPVKNSPFPPSGKTNVTSNKIFSKHLSDMKIWEPNGSEKFSMETTCNLTNAFHSIPRDDIQVNDFKKETAVSQLTSGTLLCPNITGNSEMSRDVLIGTENIDCRSKAHISQAAKGDMQFTSILPSVGKTNISRSSEIDWSFTENVSPQVNIVTENVDKLNSKDACNLFNVQNLNEEMKCIDPENPMLPVESFSISAKSANTLNNDVMVVNSGIKKNCLPPEQNGNADSISVTAEENRTVSKDQNLTQSVSKLQILANQKAEADEQTNSKTFEVARLENAAFPEVNIALAQPEKIISCQSIMLKPCRLINTRTQSDYTTVAVVTDNNKVNQTIKYDFLSQLKKSFQQDTSRIKEFNNSNMQYDETQGKPVLSTDYSSGNKGESIIEEPNDTDDLQKSSIKAYGKIEDELLETKEKAISCSKHFAIRENILYSEPVNIEMDGQISESGQIISTPPSSFYRHYLSPCLEDTQQLINATFSNPESLKLELTHRMLKDCDQKSDTTDGDSMCLWDQICQRSKSGSNEFLEDKSCFIVDTSIDLVEEPIPFENEILKDTDALEKMEKPENNANVNKTVRNSDYHNYTIRSENILGNIQKYLLVISEEEEMKKMERYKRLENLFQESVDNNNKIRELLKNFRLPEFELELLEDLFKSKHEDASSTISSISDNNMSIEQEIKCESIEDLIAPKTLYERVCEVAERSKKHWQLVKTENDYYYFYALFGTVPFKAHVHPELGIVYSIQTYCNIGSESKPIIFYNAEILYQKLKSENLLSALGVRYDLLSLLDYVSVTVQEILYFQNEFSQLRQTYRHHQITFEKDFRVTFRIVNVPLIIWWVISVKLSLNTIGCPEQISAYQEIGEKVNEADIISIAQKTLQSSNFLDNFIKNIEEYVKRITKKLKFR